MSEKFQNKYRIPSARWQHWDYGSQGAYFITICTKNREHFFGSVKDGEMILNELGLIVKNEWIKTIEKRPDMNLELGEFVVMPNHFHAVILIGHNEYNSKNNHDEIKDGFDTIKINETEKYRTVSDDETYNCDDMVTRDGTVTRGGTVTRRDAMHCVSTINVPSIPTATILTPIPTTSQKNQFGVQSKNLASIVRGFKSSVTTNSKIIGNNHFAWQPRYHDHVIRDAQSFERIQQYILNNPKKWIDDTFYN